MTTDDLTKRIARALDKNFNPDRYPIMAAMFIDYAAAVLPIVEAEVRKAKAEALREAAARVLTHPPIDRYGRVMTGARAAAKAIDRLADEYETGDQT